MTEANRILVLSESEAIADTVRAAIASDDNSRIEAVEGTLARLNGSAYSMLAGHDLMIFEIDVNDESQLGAVEALALRRGDDKKLIAMTDGEVSLAKARRLQMLGVDEVLPVGISPDELRESLARTFRAHPQAVAPVKGAEGTVLCFAQARGGIGSTTVAVNVAQQLARTRSAGRKSPMNRVVLVDLDLQFGSANVFLDLEDNGGLFKMIEARETPDSAYMRTVVQHHSSGLDIVSAPVTIAPLTAIRVATISAMLDALQAEYDFVVIDLPRALVDWLEPVVERCARLAIVTDTSVPCIRHSRRLLDFYRESNLGLPVDLVVNHEKRPFLPARHIREAEQALGAKIAHWLPHNTKVARKAADYGVPIVAGAARSDLGKSLIKLTARFAATRTETVARAGH